MRVATVDPNVLLTAVFVSWVALFALAVAAVVRHERSREAAAQANEPRAAEAGGSREKRAVARTENHRRIPGAERGETAAVLDEKSEGSSRGRTPEPDRRWRG